MGYTSLSKIANAVIEEIQAIKDPFQTPVIVFHNSKIAQWFKAYYLKNHTGVMMNVKFMTLSVFANDLLNPTREYTIMGKDELRSYILKALLDYSYNPSNPKDPINYIFFKSGKLNGTNLYEFANRLAGLFIDYEYDNESFSGWQRDLYDKALSLAEADKCYTSKGLYEEFGITGDVTSPVFVINNSYMTALFSEILGKCENVTVYTTEPMPARDSTRQKKLIAAPSMLREVEAVHSEICKILMEDKEAKYGDILIYAPDINAYVNTIHRVFLQDNKTYPDIPVRIVGALREHKDMTDSLALLFHIATKRFFTRNDFHKFVSNPMIRWIKGIEEADIKAWMDAIIQTNTHRSGKELDEWNDDWDYLKKRLILSKVVANTADAENKITLGNGKTYLPYSAMELDDDRMDKLIDIIDALMRWTSLFPKELNDILIDETKLKEIAGVLDELYSMPDRDWVEKNYLYRSVSDTVREIERLQMQLPANTFMQLLMGSPDRYAVNPADMFVGGVTCASLNCDDIAAAKYVFVMGLTSKAFPRIDLSNELDLSTKRKSSKELDILSIDNLCADAQRITFSYINRDLQKDAEQFPSAVIPLGKKDAVEIQIDETRDYSELFTQKEIKYKDDFSKIGEEHTTVPTDFLQTFADPTEEEPLVKLSEFEKFIKNTFIYRYEKHLKTNESDEKDVLEEYEVIDVNPLKRYGVVKELATLRVKNRVEEMYQMSQKLPGTGIGQAYFTAYDKFAEAIRKELDTGYEMAKLEDLELTDGNGHQWTLNCNYEIFRKAEATEIRYLEPRYAKAENEGDIDKKDGLKYFLKMYTFSLMDVAAKKDEAEYHVFLWHPQKSKEYTLTPKKATEILNNFYAIIIKPQSIRYMDAAFLQEEYKKLRDKYGMNVNDPEFIATLPQSIAKLDEKIQRNHDWEYFKDRNMPDVYEEFGYTDQNFAAEFCDCLTRIGILITDII